MGNGIVVTFTPNGLEASVLITNLRKFCYPTRDEIVEELREQGIVYGINDAIIDQLIDMKILTASVVIAHGDAPLAGRAGRIEVTVDTSSRGKPKVLSDGNVDYHDISYFVNVSKGDVLAKRIPPLPGVEGRSVFGNLIPAAPPEDARFCAGAGACISKSDANDLVAGNDGGFWMQPDGTIHVCKLMKIPGDIDYQTGDITFAGDLEVEGTIRAGFSVETKGALHIGGGVENCLIKCQSDVVIEGGVSGSGSGSITCKGSIKAHHLERFNVVAGGEVEAKQDIVHAVITSNSVVRAKSILGGSVTSMIGIEAESIGGDAEAKTLIDIGTRYLRMRRRDELLSKLAAITTKLADAKERVFQIVRDSLDSDGVLSQDNETLIEAIKLETAELNLLNAATLAEIEKLDDGTPQGEKPFVKAKTIFPNTVIKYGAGEHMIRQRMENVRLSPVVQGTTVTLACDTF